MKRRWWAKKRDQRSGRWGWYRDHIMVTWKGRTATLIVDIRLTDWLQDSLEEAQQALTEGAREG